MSFDKFKKLMPKPVAQPEGTDDYFKELANLEENKPESRVVPIISTIAAAVAIVVLVSLWAIIGSGIRKNAAIVPAEKYEDTELYKQELTPALDFEIWKFISENKLEYLPVFDAETPPVLEHLIYVCEQTRNELCQDLVLTKQEFESFTYDLLGYKVKLKKDIKYKERPLVHEYDIEGSKITSYSTSDVLENGFTIVEVGFQYGKSLKKTRWLVNAQNELEYVISNIFEDKNYPTPKRDKSITDELREIYFDFVINYRVDAIPEFSEGEVPEVEKMKLYTAHYEPYLSEPDDIPVDSDKIKQVAKDLFGIENVTSDDTDYIVKLEDLNELPYSELIQYSKEETDSGTIITATVGIRRYYGTYTIRRYDDHRHLRKIIIEGNEWMPYFYRICKFKYIAKADGVTPEKFIEVKHIDNSKDEFSDYFE